MCLILEKCRSGGNSLIISVKLGYDNEARQCALRYQGKEGTGYDKRRIIVHQGIADRGKRTE